MGHDWFQNLSEDLAGTQGLGGFDKTPTIQLDELMKETVMSRKGRYVPCIVEHVDSLFFAFPKKVSCFSPIIFSIVGLIVTIFICCSNVVLNVFFKIFFLVLVLFGTLPCAKNVF